jgi:hypothetical protein
LRRFRASAFPAKADGTVDHMTRTCSRPGCNADAAATFNFNGLERVVWLGPLDDAGAGTRSAGDLCQTHADRLSPPLHWELRDTRKDAPTRIGLAAGKDRRAPDERYPLLNRAFRAAKAG